MGTAPGFYALSTSGPYGMPCGQVTLHGVRRRRLAQVNVSRLRNRVNSDVYPTLANIQTLLTSDHSRHGDVRRTSVSFVLNCLQTDPANGRTPYHGSQFVERCTR